MFRLPIFGDIVSFFSDFHRMVIMNKRISCGRFQPTKHLIGNTCRTRPAFHRLQSVSCTEFTFQRSIETGEYLFSSLPHWSTRRNHLPVHNSSLPYTTITGNQPGICLYPRVSSYFLCLTYLPFPYSFSLGKRVNVSIVFISSFSGS